MTTPETPMTVQIEAVRLAMVACRESLSQWHEEWNPPFDREARMFVAALQAYENAKAPR